jgi:predicted enzyme related to lactoylglutathione lyase
VPTKTSYTPGTFCWVELATSDTEGAKKFYTSLFGWDVQDDDIPGGGVYSMFKINGLNVCACNPQQEAEAAAGVPPHWNSYVSVEDADQTVKIAEGAGGSVLAPPFDVMEIGRMAVLADPSGAVLSLWQPRVHIGAQIRDEDNTLSWNETITSDADRAKAFYVEVFGWEPTDMDMPQGTYTTFKVGDEWAGGMMQRSDITPNWLPYFQVADASAIASKANELGGQSLMGPEAVPGVGKIGVFTDPQGAAFGFIEPEPQQG